MSDITVVIPVWDSYCAKLAGCVEDVRAQDTAAEIVVVDNASSVALPDLPAEVRVVRLPERRSVGAARNAVLPGVATPYVFFMDADDRLLPGALSFLVDTLAADPSLVAAVGKQVLWNPVTDTRIVNRRAPRPVVYWIAHAPRLLALCSLRFNIFPLVGCAALRTEVVRSSGGFGDGNVGEDWELGAALAWRGRIRFSTRPVRLYAVEDGSLWHRAHDRRVFEECFERFRGRLFTDAALPAWARLTRRVFRWLHDRDLVRMFRAGPYTPELGLSAAAGSEPARVGTQVSEG